MTVATVTVSFLAQGQNYDVRLSTLVAPPQQMMTTTSRVY